jgi:hypothetical protein
MAYRTLSVRLDDTCDDHAQEGDRDQPASEHESPPLTFHRTALRGRIPEAQAARAEARLHSHRYDADRHPEIWSAGPAESPRRIDPLRKTMARLDRYPELIEMMRADFGTLSVMSGCKSNQGLHYRRFGIVAGSISLEF